MKKLLAMFMVLAFLATNMIGCAGVTYDQAKQYGIDSAKFAAAVSSFKGKYEDTEMIVRTKQAKENIFTDAEWRSMLNMDASIDLLLLKAESIIQLNKDSIALSDVQDMYSMAKIGYQQAYAAVANKIDKFDPLTQAQMRQLHTSAVDVDATIERLLTEPSNKNISDSLTLIATLIGIGVKVVGAAVL